MGELASDYEGKNGVIFGANSVVGTGISQFLSRICSYHLKEERRGINPDDLAVDTWNIWLKEWVLNYFLTRAEA